jgi:hypothetical protein
LTGHIRRLALTNGAVLDEIKDPDWDGEWEEDIFGRWDYGEYGDIHTRICAIDPCIHCVDRRLTKYLW